MFRHAGGIELVMCTVICTMPAKRHVTSKSHEWFDASNLLSKLLHISLGILEKTGRYQDKHPQLNILQPLTDPPGDASKVVEVVGQLLLIS